MRRRHTKFHRTWLAVSIAGALVGSSIAADAAMKRPSLKVSSAYTVCDFIDNRIDVDAQYALYIMVRRGGPSRATGLAILTAVKTGKLAGVYQQNRGKPAQLAKRHGSSWWTMLGKSKAKMIEWESPPMLVYKRTLGGKAKRASLVNALEAAWNADPLAVDKTKTPRPKRTVCAKPPTPPPKKPKITQKPKTKTPKFCGDGWIPGPDGTCVLDLPGKFDTECSEAKMNATFQRHKNFCAGVKTGLDLACNLGTNVCDIGGAPAKAACSTYEQIFGHPPPATKPTECDLPDSQFYKQCIVSTVVGESSQMACYPGTQSQISSKYDHWSGRVR